MTPELKARLENRDNLTREEVKQLPLEELERLIVRAFHLDQTTSAAANHNAAVALDEMRARAEKGERLERQIATCVGCT